MAMSNKAYWRLVHEYEYNRKWNDAFITFTDVFVKAGELPDQDEFPVSKTALCKTIRRDFKALKKYPWLEDLEEVDLYIDLMPIGGYTDFTKINSALKDLRNKRKAKRR